jgi:outer membrane protein OmpA-like peptidoglycan-associated protein
MRCNPLRWLWGLLPLALLAWYTGFSQHTPIEADLKGRVEAALKAERLGWASASFEGRDGVLTGRATEEAEQSRAIQIARDTWGVRVVENRTELIEKSDTYVWNARREGRRLQIAGMVPNETTRAAILGTARSTVPDVEVVDQMRPVRGVPSPDTWLTGINFGLRQLAQLRTGEARLEGLGLTLSGEATSETAYRSVRTALGGDLPRGVRLVDERITPPVVRPYTWSASAADQRVTMTGYVPSDAARTAVRQAARAAFPRVGDAIDQMRLGGGAPAEFAATTSASLRELAKLEEGTAELRDSTLTVAGLAADQATAEAVRRSLRAAVPAGVRITEQIRFREPPPPPPPPAAPAPAPPVFSLPPLPTPQVVAPVSPYTGQIDYDGSRVVVSGYVPNDAARETVIRAARQRFPGRPLDDRLRLGSGEPPGWERCFDGAMAGVARLGGGRASLTDRRVEVTGRTDDEALATAVPGEVRTAVQGACEVEPRITVTPPPEPDLVWAANYTGRELVLEGQVPAPETRDALLAQARRQFPDAQVRDAMQVVPGRAQTWSRVAELGLGSLVGTRSGRAELRRRELTVTGDAMSAERPAAVREQLASAFGATAFRGYQGVSRITYTAPTPPPAPPPAVIPPPPPPPVLTRPESIACQANLKRVAAAGVINFEFAKADLTPDSIATLNGLVAAARDCPRVTIDVEGHTDSEGTPERNQRLSDRRAATVVNFLVRAGIDPAILSPVGYGETRPVAPNDTPENRARNRRIEFTVRE